MLKYSDLLPEEEILTSYAAGELTYPDLMEYNRRRVSKTIDTSETVESLANEFERQELQRINKARKIKKTVPTS